MRAPQEILHNKPMCFLPYLEKINYASDGEDWSANDSYLADYEYNKELE